METEGLWTAELRQRAQAQGWDLFVNDGGAGLRLEACLDTCIFKNDDQAWEHVRKAFLLGDQPAVTAVMILAIENPVECIQLLADRGVYRGEDGATSVAYDTMAQFIDTEGERAESEILEAVCLLMDRLGMGDYLGYFLSAYFAGLVQDRTPFSMNTSGGDGTYRNKDLPGQTNLMDQIGDDPQEE